MFQKVSKTEEILKRLSENGSTTILDKQEHKDAVNEMNKIMEETKRDFQVMDQQSQISASRAILTA
jgi:hypothetical protein